MDEIKQIVPCAGWVFVGDSEDKGDIVMPVAAWAWLKAGGVVGLIPDRSQEACEPPVSLGVPAFPGTYCLVEQLTDWQREQYNKTAPHGPGTGNLKRP